MSCTKDGGKPIKYDLPYSPPQGPKDQSHEAPGLGGSNHGNAPTQGRH
jgi:hypothetical protein